MTISAPFDIAPPDIVDQLDFFDSNYAPDSDSDNPGDNSWILSRCVDRSAVWAVQAVAS